MNIKFKPSRVTLGLVVVAIIGAFAAMALSANGSEGHAGAFRAPTKQPRPASPPLSAGQAQVSLRHSFALFRRPVRPSDRIPQVHTSKARATGAISGASRLAYSGAAGNVYAYVQGASLCVEYHFEGSDPGGTGSCAPADAASRFGVALSTLQTNGTHLVALLPDDIKTVTVDKTQGSHQDLPVSNNIFLHAGNDATDWQFVDASRVRHTVPLPNLGKMASEARQQLRDALAAQRTG